MLGELVKSDAGQFPEVDRVARATCKTPRDVHSFIKHAVLFEREEGEIFRSPKVTLLGGVGDCDCQSRLACYMLRSIGFPSRLVFLAGIEGGPKHVVAQAEGYEGTPKQFGWHWVETTMDAAYDEEPVRAAVRLGALRPDVTEGYARREYSEVFR